MRPETSRELDRLLRRQRLRQVLVAVAVIVPLVALFVLFGLPHEAGPVIPVRLAGFENRESGNAGDLRLVLEDENGRTIRLAASPGEARLQPGATLCLVEMRQWMTGRTRYARSPAARCATVP